AVRHPNILRFRKEGETTDLTDQDGFSRIDPSIRLNPLNPWFLREIELTTRCWGLSRQFPKSLKNLGKDKGVSPE
ncbi:MAG: hypothetical protein ACREEM_38480, partial [Blastocatellia bacterium]